MKNLIIMLVGVLGTLTGAGIESKADKEVHKAEIATYQDSLQVVRKKLTTELMGNSEQLPEITPVPCTPTVIHDTLKTECEDCGKLVSIALSKIKDCPKCSVCDTTALQLLGYEIDHEYLVVSTNKVTGQGTSTNDLTAYIGNVIKLPFK